MVMHDVHGSRVTCGIRRRRAYWSLRCGWHTQQWPRHLLRDQAELLGVPGTPVPARAGTGDLLVSDRLGVYDDLGGGQCAV